MTKIALLSFAILVAGCTSRTEQLVQQYELNDSICKKSHVYGTGSYWNCRAGATEWSLCSNNTLRRALMCSCRRRGRRDSLRA